MGGAVIWMGPVSTVNLAQVALPADWTILTISQEVVAPGRPAAQGLTPTDFRTYAASLGSDPLGALLAKAGASEAVLASFSAGHGLLDPLLQANAGDPRIDGVYAADSYYGLDLKKGYEAHGRACVASGSKFWLSTSSSKDGTITIHSGSESLPVLARALGLEDTQAPAGMPSPVGSQGKGGVLWLDYQALFSHGQHATMLCPTALNLWFGAPGGIQAPFGGSASAPDSEASPGAALAVGLMGAALGYFGYRWAAPRLGLGRVHVKSDH